MSFSAFLGGLFHGQHVRSLVGVCVFVCCETPDISKPGSKETRGCRNYMNYQAVYYQAQKLKEIFFFFYKNDNKD